MNNLSGIIGISDLKVRCVVGCTPAERSTLQDIFLDLKVSCDISAVAETDDIKNTIDYVMLSDFCQRLAVEKKFKLIECIATEIVKQVLSHFPIKGIWIRVKKASGLKAANYAFVEVKHGDI